MTTPPQSLRLSPSGDLWLVDSDGERVRLLGRIGEADVPEELMDEYEYLLGEWRDALGGGHEAEAIAVYAETRGCRR